MDVLRKMIFFKVCEKFIAEGNRPSMYTGRSPTVGTMELKAPLDILVIKENTADIQSEWRYTPPDTMRHMIIVTENLNFLKPIEDILTGCLVRVFLEQDLFDRSKKLANIFHKWNGQKWEK